MAKKKPNKEIGQWKYPPISLLKEVPSPVKDDEAKKVSQIVQKVFDDYIARAKVVNRFSGPHTIKLHIQLGRGIKMNEVTKLKDEIIRALNAYTEDITFSKFVPGTPYIGLEIPRKETLKVSLKSMLNSQEMKKHKSKLAVPLGLDGSGKEVFADIDRMPHVLIAGSTDSGKSVFINSIISTILYRATPQEVRFILVDPKRDELAKYNDIPHLLTPVIVEPEKAISALMWANSEMNRRYEVFAETGAMNISSYNKLSGFQALPYLVIVIDELADIILFAPSEVEDSIIRLAQMARATGIHLVIATQRPSSKVLKGMVKANINCRIAFNVNSKIDSRAILDMPGAEKLEGEGDMLYCPPDQAKPIRFQTPYISKQEVISIINDIKENHPESLEEEKYKKSITDIDGEDELYDKAVEVVGKYDRASASLIQRRLMIGYARAARLIDMLEKKGIVGSGEGGRPRKVFKKKV